MRVRKSHNFKFREFDCISCGIHVAGHNNKSQKYCSLECYRKSKRPDRKTGSLINCDCCNVEFYRTKSATKDTNFCSVKCLHKFQGRNKIEFNCLICNKQFKWSPSRIVHGNPKYCSISCRNKDFEHLSRVSLQGNLANMNKNGRNRLEQTGYEILTTFNIEFEEQVPMFNKFLVDVLIESKKLVIQWDGEYWHLKENRKNLDKSQDAYLKKCGYRVLRITDKQIKNEIDIVYKTIEDELFKD